MDNDDEVRDRATYFKAILEQHEASLNSGQERIAAAAALTAPLPLSPLFLCCCRRTYLLQKDAL